MKVLIACEESQAVCIEFRKLGIEAFSCDIQECSGGHPEWHIQGDVLEVMNWRKNETAKDGSYWQMMIAFPPCTDIAISGAAHFAKKIKDGRQKKGIDFFISIANANIKFIAIENPVNIIGRYYRKADQIIQPYFFGDEAQKTTCLWLKNLPKLIHNDKPNLFDPVVTHTGKGEFMIDKKTGRRRSKWLHSLPPSPERGKLRSKTFPGIARQMALQWSAVLNK